MKNKKKAKWCIKKDPLSVEHSKRHGKAVKLGLKRATKLKRQVKRASLMLRNNTKEQLCKSLFAAPLPLQH